MIRRREYKMMLKAGKFSSRGRFRHKQIGKCWRDFSSALEAAGFEVARELETQDPEKQREVVFLDTRGLELREGCGFVFRARRKPGEGWQHTLKYRSGDWLRSQSADSTIAAGGKSKFEEDVKLARAKARANYLPLFSHSASIKREGEGLPGTLAEALSPFGDAIERTGLAPGTPLEIVNSKRFAERVYEGGEINLPDGRLAEAAIILWSRADSEDFLPEVAEFSFRYKLNRKIPNTDRAFAAWEIFKLLNAQRKWVDRKGPTKTAFAYGESH